MTFRQLWISVIIASVAATMMLGALTRLTGSGLSIVKWEPISGILPPSSAESWTSEFLRYQQFPEFKSNSSMTLDKFKSIYWWEYSHRILARSLLLVILCPYLLLLFFRRATSNDLKHVIISLLLLSAQGVLGWYMVASGLVDVPRVSHLRLALHLVWGSLIVGFLGRWLRQESIHMSKNLGSKDPLFLRTLSWICICQIALGGLVAGSRAGYIFNTFPKMGDLWAPKQFLLFPTVLENLIYNQINLQFFHRIGAWLVFIGGIYGVWRGHYLLGFLVLIQFSLGVLTLVQMIPIPMAALHQLFATLLYLVISFSQPLTQQR